MKYGQTRAMVSYGRMIMGACLLSLVLLSCRERHTPTTHPKQYNSLLQQVAAEARAREDSSMLLLRNTDNKRIRALMLDLGVDYIRYNRERGLVCTWHGGGMDRARGFAYRIPGPPPAPLDSVGERCYRSASCTESETETEWVRWECP